RTEWRTKLMGGNGYKLGFQLIELPFTTQRVARLLFRPLSLGYFLFQRVDRRIQVFCARLHFLFKFRSIDQELLLTSFQGLFGTLAFRDIADERHHHQLTVYIGVAQAYRYRELGPVSALAY